MLNIKLSESRLLAINGGEIGIYSTCRFSFTPEQWRLLPVKVISEALKEGVKICYSIKQGLTVTCHQSGKVLVSHGGGEASGSKELKHMILSADEWFALTKNYSDVIKVLDN